MFVKENNFNTMVSYLNVTKVISFFVIINEKVILSSLFHLINFIYFCGHGEMAEWSKAHAWKVCNRQKRFMGSNPILSAIFLFYIFFGFIVTAKQMPGKFNFSFMVIFSLVMVLLYIGIGIYLLVSKTFDYIPMQYRSVFAIFLMLYGIFRFVRIYPKLTNKRRYEDD